MDKKYYDETDDIALYWEKRYQEWLQRPDWGVFPTKDAWFTERFAHIIGEGLEPSPTLDGVRGSDLVDGRFVSGTVLDFGCGNAMYGTPLLRRFKKYVGVDTSETALQIAEIYYTRHPELRERMLLKRFPDLESELDYIKYNFWHKFDCVVSITVLQHQPLPLRRKIIQAIKQVLKPGGLYAGLEWNEATTQAFDMPPMDTQDWINEWKPMEIVWDRPASHPEWAADHVWSGRMPK